VDKKQIMEARNFIYEDVFFSFFFMGKKKEEKTSLCDC